MIQFFGLKCYILLSFPKHGELIGNTLKPKSEGAENCECTFRLEFNENVRACECFRKWFDSFSQSIKAVISVVRMARYRTASIEALLCI